ncbi:MAG TPA: undecaprenyl-diphosphate phosphatase [Alphaproteobacteria bacterium]|nr:undecaprenyl-diphosphate phosphatase [Alphaproteobacteria bacterium]
MSALQAILFAVLQGVTELFPVSSLGHAVILPKLLGWQVDQRGRDFLPFLVVLHAGTAAALLLYFWRDWIDIARAVLGIGNPSERAAHLRLLALVVVGTIPAVVIGFSLEKPLRALFGTPLVAAAFLVANGVVLFAAERLKRSGGAALATLDAKKALVIGLWQSLALIPGISRSGATMVGGLLSGLHHKEAAHFSFLLATPIIAGAAVLEVPKLMHASEAGGGLGPVAVLAGLAAGITAYASVAFLMRYFGKHDFEALDPFAYYCAAAGVVSLALLLFVV